MLWWFSNVTDILKTMEWFVLRMDTYREHEILWESNQNFIQFSFKFTLEETPENMQRAHTF